MPFRGHPVYVAGMFLLLTSVFLIFGCRSKRDDLLILRDGSLKYGRLDNCSGQTCTLDGSAIPRPTVVFIGLNDAQLPPPQVQDWLQDEVRLVDASIHRGQVLTIDAARVTTIAATYLRKRVAWVYLAPTGIPGSPGATGSPGTTTADSAKDVPPYLWEGRIEVENTYDGLNGRHRWKAEYVAKFLEVRTSSSKPGKQPGTSFPVSNFTPLELKYVIDADTSYDKGSHKLQIGGNNKIVSGDVRMLGQANGTLTAGQLEKGQVLGGDIITLDAPLRTTLETPPMFTSFTQYTNFIVDHVSTPSEPGWYQIWLQFIQYGNYRERQSYSPEYYQDVCELYRGINRTGQEPLFFPDPNHDFLHWVPASMPDGTMLFGRLDTPDQAEVRGELSFPVEGGISNGPHDAQRITVSWQFKRSQQ